MDHVRYRLATIDLDGTLLHGTVFEAVARGAGFLDKVERHDSDYISGKITLEECFRLEYRYLVGLKVHDIERWLSAAPWLGGVQEAVAMLRDAGLQLAVLTDQPRFLCDFLARFGLTQALCSEARVQDGVVTADLTPRFDKLAKLRQYCRREEIDLSSAIHIGNDANDMRVFKAVGLGVAVNPTRRDVQESADLCFDKVDDLRPVAEAVLEAVWNEEPGP